MKTQVKSQDTTASQQEEFLYTAIRNGHFVQLRWQDLDKSERRAIQRNIFLLYGAEF